MRKKRSSQLSKCRCRHTYLYNDGLDVAHSSLLGHVAIHGFLCGAHGHQDACVWCHYDGAGQEVTGDEEGEGVRAGAGLEVGQAHVDAAGGTVGLRAVLTPVGQGATGKDQGVQPGTHHQQTSVDWSKPVTCIACVGRSMWFSIYIGIYIGRDCIRKVVFPMTFFPPFYMMPIT